MSTVILYAGPDCPANLQVGPGKVEDNAAIQFDGTGYAELDTDDPLFAKKMSWTMSFGAPVIRTVTEDERTIQKAIAAGLAAAEREAGGYLR